MNLLTNKKTGRTYLALGLAGALGLGTLGTSALVSQAQPDPNNAPKTENPNNRQARQRRQRITPEQRTKMMQDREIAMLEQATGKTLTEDQKTALRKASDERQAAIKAAQDKYLEEMSKATGMEVDELKLKMRDARARNLLGAVNAMNNRRGQGQGQAKGQNNANNNRRQNRQNRGAQQNGAAAQL